jgi:hypothetical protein
MRLNPKVRLLGDTYFAVLLLPLVELANGAIGHGRQSHLDIQTPFCIFHSRFCAQSILRGVWMTPPPMARHHLDPGQ